MALEKSKKEYTRLLRKSFLLEQTSEQAVEELLAEGCRSLPFSKGQIILGQGKNLDCLGLIISGRASARSGGTVILRSFGRGDIFGAATVFASDAKPFSEIVAESTGEALLLPLAAIHRLLASQPQSAENYIRFLAERVAFLNRKIEALGSGEAVKRLAAHLTASCQPDAQGRLACHVSVSRLAQSLSLSRASVYRALDQLLQGGCLHREGKTIIIDSWDSLAAYK